MKKVASIFVALLLVAVSVVSAFAADINANEKKVLDELKTSVKMQGKDMYWPESFVNQAENYFNTIDLTAEQADEIVTVNGSSMEPMFLCSRRKLPVSPLKKSFQSGQTSLSMNTLSGRE